jgi:hypothetical protein
MITILMRLIFALPSAIRTRVGRISGGSARTQQPEDSKPGSVRFFLLVILLIVVYAVLFAIAVRRGGEPIPCPPPSEGQYPYCG